MNSTKSLTTTLMTAPTVRAVPGFRSARVFEPRLFAVSGARLRSYAPSAFVAASSHVAVASRIAVPSHVVLATRVMDDAWAAKKGLRKPRGGPA